MLAGLATWDTSLAGHRDTHKQAEFSPTPCSHRTEVSVERSDGNATPTQRTTVVLPVLQHGVHVVAAKHHVHTAITVRLHVLKAHPAPVHNGGGPRNSSVG